MSLTKSPEFTGFPNLEDLVLEGCTALVDLHPSSGKSKKLKKLNFGYCSSLQTLPYGIESQCLEVLIFSGCWKLNNNILENFEDLKQLSELDLEWTGITELPQLIGNSTNLISLNCTGCRKLESIPNSIGQLKKLKTLSFSGCRKLESIPRSIGQLKKLKWFHLSDCYSLSELPEEVGLIDILQILVVENSRVGKLPASIVQLRKLQTLSCTPSTSQISNSIPLELPSFPVFESLTKLYLMNSRLTSIPESVCLCVSLKYLLLNQSDFESLPTSIKYLSNLEELWVINCKSLQELPELPPNVVTIQVEGCNSLKTICNLTVYRDATTLVFSGCPKLVGNEEINVLLGYKFLSDHIKKNNCRSIIEHCGPGSKIPEWFSYQNVGASVTYLLPILDSTTFNLLGFVVSVVVATKHKDLGIVAKIRTRGKFLSLGSCWISPSDVEQVVILYFPIKLPTTYQLIRMSGTVSKVYFDVIGPARVMECGVHPFYKEEVGSSGKINQPLRLME